MAVRFDAASDRVSIAATLPDPATAITITGWAYVSADTGTNATMCRVHAVSGASTTITFATDGGAPAGVGYFTAGGSIVSSTQSPVGSWRKVALTCTGTSGNVYVATVGGGTDTDSGTVAGVAAPSGLTLGGRSSGDSSEWFNGRLAYWRVWSAVLSQSEIEAEWASTTPVRTSGLWADWPLEVHTDLTDHSGNGRDLTAGSTATTTEDGPPLAGPITGSGAVTAPAAEVSGAGTVTVTGAGALTAAASGIAGSASVVVSGAGSVTAEPAVVDGDAAVTVFGSGTGEAPAAELSGSGAAVVAGQGSVVAVEAVVAGAGQVIITGTGVIVAPAAAISGAGGEPGELTEPPARRTFEVSARQRTFEVPARTRTWEA